jgi:hypothetical protein
MVYDHLYAYEQLIFIAKNLATDQSPKELGKSFTIVWNMLQNHCR